MTKKCIYFNQEYLPNKDERQIALFLTAPSFQFWYLSAPIYIGYNNGIGFKEWTFVLFGFGLILNHNWDE